MITLLAAILLIQEKPLTADQQKAQLAKRVKADKVFHDLMGRPSKLGRFCEDAWTFHDVNICSDLDIGKVELVSPFPDSYEPTWGEVLETVARQTSTSFAYSEKHTGWLLAKPALAQPFTFPLAKEWKQEEDMKKVTIDGVEALHVETPAPKDGVTWRQWVFVKDGRATAIVSALDNDKEALLKDVKAMVAGFKFVKDAKK